MHNQINVSCRFKGYDSNKYDMLLIMFCELDINTYLYIAAIMYAKPKHLGCKKNATPRRTSD